MKYSDNNLLNYTSYYELENFEEQIEQVLGVVHQTLNAISQNMHIDLVSKTDFLYFGSITTNNNINPNDPIDLLIKINNPFLLDVNKEYLHTKSRKKRATLMSTANILQILSASFYQALTPVSKVSLNGSNILIDSLGELGKNYRIFVVASKNTESGECYGINSTQKSIFKYNIETAIDNFNQKNKSTNGNFSDMINIIKSISYDVNARLNEFAIESLIYNVPNKFFEGEANIQLLKVLNYIKLSNYDKFTSIDENGDIKSNGFIDTNILELKKFIEQISYALQ